MDRSRLESKFSELRFLCTFKSAAVDGILVAFNRQVFSDGLWSGFLRLGPGAPPLLHLLRSPAALATQVTDSQAARAALPDRGTAGTGVACLTRTTNGPWAPPVPSSAGLTSAVAFPVLHLLIGLPPGDAPVAII